MAVGPSIHKSLMLPGGQIEIGYQQGETSWPARSVREATRARRTGGALDHGVTNSNDDWDLRRVEAPGEGEVAAGAWQTRNGQDCTDLNS